MKRGSFPRSRPDLQLQDVDGELLLCDPESKRVVYLSRTASLIWQLCDGKRSIEQVTRLLQDTYPENAAVIPADVKSAMAHLEKNDALDWL